MNKIPGYGNIARAVKVTGVKSEVPIESDPSPAKIEEIVAKRKPVLIRGLKIGQCTQKWTSEYLKSKCIDSKISVRISNQPILDFINKNYEFITLTFPEFMDKVFTEPNENDNERYYFRSIGENPRKDVSNIWKSFPDLATDFVVPEQFSFIKVSKQNKLFKITLLTPSKIGKNIFERFPHQLAGHSYVDSLRRDGQHSVSSSWQQKSCAVGTKRSQTPLRYRYVLAFYGNLRYTPENDTKIFYFFF